MTKAEQALEAFNAKTKTAPLADFAVPLGATVRKFYNWDKRRNEIWWQFPDASELLVTGRGRSYHVEVL